MIIYDLSCDSNHQFEGWFQNADAFEAQLVGKLVCCPQCDSHSIRRIPSAVAISGHHPKPEGEPSAPSATQTSTALMPAGTQVMAIYRQLVQAIVNNSEDVGQSFVEEARKIHYNEAPQRPIRGQASEDECDALRDEGIQILNLPLGKEDIQ